MLPIISPGYLGFYNSSQIIRWALATANSESSGNAGSDLAVNAYNDAGSLLANYIQLIRASGRIALVNGAYLTCVEITAPSGITGSDVLWCDSSAHRWKINNNNGGAQTIATLTDFAAPPAIGNTTPAAGSFTTLKGTTLNTTTNCASGASPAVCGSAAAGAVAVPTGTNPTLVVDTSAVTANSLILLTIDESLTISATTCNTTLATLVEPVVTARSAGVSFTMQIGATVASNPACVSYVIVN